jgi:hypothetical protein
MSLVQYVRSEIGAYESSDRTPRDDSFEVALFQALRASPAMSKR